VGLLLLLQLQLLVQVQPLQHALESKAPNTTAPPPPPHRYQLRMMQCTQHILGQRSISRWSTWWTVTV
jgi:hypothetical protein